MTHIPADVFKEAVRWRSEAIRRWQCMGATTLAMLPFHLVLCFVALAHDDKKWAVAFAVLTLACAIHAGSCQWQARGLRLQCQRLERREDIWS